MKTSGIRQKLHNYLEVAEDKKVKAIYTMMQESIKESAVDYSKEFKAELDTCYETSLCLGVCSHAPFASIKFRNLLNHQFAKKESEPRERFVVTRTLAL
jgi:heterodisulfide reductase subunit C